MGFGNWEININTNGMPQKIATAFSELNETMLGVEYDFVAYLGSQEANGVNSAVLAEQTVVTGRDTKNVAVVVFNEKPGDGEDVLVGIDRIVESGDKLGGIVVDVKTEIPADAQAAWDKAFEGYVGANIKPFALLGTQIVNGTNYIFAAEMTGIVKEPVAEAVIVTLNSNEHRADIVNMMKSKQDASLGYAFTWLS